MIKETQVKEIIRKHSLAQTAQERRAKTGELPDDLKYCSEKKALLNYLQELSQDELIDLCALMDYGRECTQRETQGDAPELYWQMRNNFFEDHKEDPYLHYYLLGNARLGIYLRRAVDLYDEDE